MTWEPVSLAELSDDPPVLELAPGVPVEFERPSDAELAWQRESAFQPAALVPLTSDYTLLVGQSLNTCYDLFGGGFPQCWRWAVWHGYVYSAWEANVDAAAWAKVRRRLRDLCWERADVTKEYWDREVLPELHSIYRRTDDVDAEATPGTQLADAWERAWRDAERAWQLHMGVLLGPTEVLEALGEIYRSVDPQAPAAEAYRLIQGSEHELFLMERATVKLAGLARATPAVADALGAGVRSLEDLEKVDGGGPFVAAVRDFLQTHGHMGQSVDNLTMPSFGDEPAIFLTELAKRLDGAGEDADERRLRLASEADRLAERARERLADRPEILGRFNRVLALAREIGPLSERHNYWIDRAELAHLRRLVLRVGARLVWDGVIEAPTDIFYLRRAEVGPLLRHPTDRREIVDDRRRTHEQDKQLRPAAAIGRREAVAGGPVETPRATEEVGVLRGMGASAGTARGPARVVLGTDEFGRIHRGDIIVCNNSNPSWVPVFSIAGGLVTNVGGVLSHAAVVAREFGLPAVVGVKGATTTIDDGHEIEIDGTAGTVRLM